MVMKPIGSPPYPDEFKEKFPLLTIIAIICLVGGVIYGVITGNINIIIVTVFIGIVWFVCDGRCY